MSDIALPGLDAWITREPYDPIADIDAALAEEAEASSILASYDDCPPAVQIDPDTGIEVTL